MKRKLLAAVAGFVTWWVVATVLDRLLRIAWPGYAEVLPALAFSLGMLLARLVEGAVSTIVAGVVATWIARRGTAAAVATGALLLVLFVPTHAMLWSKFPVWYHLTFLGSLLPLTLVGALLLRSRESRAVPHRSLAARL